MWRCATLVAFLDCYACLNLLVLLSLILTFTCRLGIFRSIGHSLLCTFFFLRSKTDPFRAGITLRLAAIQSHALCSVRAMRHYLQFRSATSGPLFFFQDGAHLSRAFLVAFLRMALPGVRNIDSHSFVLEVPLPHYRQELRMP